MIEHNALWGERFSLLTIGSKGIRSVRVIYFHGQKIKVGNMAIYVLDLVCSRALFHNCNFYMG
jgi:hypothetical protein